MGSCCVFFRKGLGTEMKTWEASKMWPFSVVGFEKDSPCIPGKMYIFNPLYTNGFSLLVSYNKLGIVHCAYLGVSGYNLKKKYLFFFLPEDLFLP